MFPTGKQFTPKGPHIGISSKKVATFKKNFKGITPSQKLFSTSFFLEHSRIKKDKKAEIGWE